MPKETKKQLVQKWLRKHKFGGTSSYWDGKRRYELTIEDIIKIANYLKTILEKNKEKDNQNVLQNHQQRQ